jgi:hypothetical protein
MIIGVIIIAIVGFIEGWQWRRFARERRGAQSPDYVVQLGRMTDGLIDTAVLKAKCIGRGYEISESQRIVVNGVRVKITAQVDGDDMAAAPEMDAHR